MTKSEKIKYLLVPAIGFGIGGGLLWLGGIILFQEIIVGVALFILVGSLSLVLLENIKFYKKILFTLAITIIGTVIILAHGLMCLVLVTSDSLPFDFMYYLGIFTSLLFFLFFWLGPVLLIIFYALALKLLVKMKIRIWPLFWRGLVGFILATPIGLVLGGIIGSELLNLEFWPALFAFVLAGIILGLFLGWGLYRGQKLKEIAEQKREKT